MQGTSPALLTKENHGTSGLHHHRRDQPVFCHSVEEEPDGKPWFYDIKRFLQKKEYPKEANEKDKKTLRRLAMNFFLNGEVLYKRNHDMTLLRCVDAAEAQKILKEIHEGSFGTHANRHSMARTQAIIG